jgi:phage N-6-adenine-methyltransferase
MNAPSAFGHNETTVRLGLLAEDARNALACVESGESTALDGWLAYGAALNEGRALFPSNEQFGQWIVSSNLEGTSHPAERVAAMWAAAYPEQFDTARAAGNARTVRGIHAKWQEIDAERKAAEERERAAAERAKAEAERKAAEEARRKAEAERREAKAKADAEAAAKRAEQQAKDAEQRRIAQEAARIAAAARAESERKAAEEDAKARAADQAAKASEKTAVAADKSAKAADKRAANAKKGNPTPDKKAHVSNNSGENEWYTPVEFITAARAVMGSIDLDPASSPIANRTVGAAQFYTAEDDGLAQDWPVGRIWMNPPYAQPLMGQFADRLAAEVRRGSEAVVLVNNATETGWFQVMAAECSAICFPRSRTKFLDPEGRPGAPLQGQAIIYSGPDPDAFEQAFGGFGLVVRHG